MLAAAMMLTCALQGAPEDARRVAELLLLSGAKPRLALHSPAARRRLATLFLEDLNRRVDVGPDLAWAKAGDAAAIERGVAQAVAQLAVREAQLQREVSGMSVETARQRLFLEGLYVYTARPVIGSIGTLGSWPHIKMGYERDFYRWLLKERVLAGGEPARPSVSAPKAPSRPPVAFKGTLLLARKQASGDR